MTAREYEKFVRAVNAQERRRQKLLAQLTKRYTIGDRDALERAVREAERLYHAGGAVPEEYAEQLRKLLPKVIAAIVDASDDEFVRLAQALAGPGGDAGEHAGWLWDCARDLDKLRRAVQPRDGRGNPNMNYHRAVLSLEQYWKKSLGRALSRHRVRHNGRWLTKGQSMRFLEDVLRFIDRPALKQLRSVTRHRVKGLPRIASK